MTKERFKEIALVECLFDNVDKINWDIKSSKITTIINKMKIILSVSSIINEYSMILASDGTCFEIKEENDMIKDLCKKCVHFWIDFPIIKHRLVSVSHCEILDKKCTKKYLDEEVDYPCLECSKIKRNKYGY